MSRSIPIRSAAAVAAAVIILLAPALAQPPLEGRWVLVEQTYGKGKANLAGQEQPVCLEFYTDGGGQQAARAWRADESSASWGWPVWLAEGKPLPLRLLQRSVDPGAGTVAVRYTVQPSAGDSMVLEVEESYRLEEAGTALVGTVKATFRVGEETRGGFVLHRRFERMP